MVATEVRAELQELINGPIHDQFVEFADIVRKQTRETLQEFFPNDVAVPMAPMMPGEVPAQFSATRTAFAPISPEKSSGGGPKLGEVISRFKVQHKPTQSIMDEFGLFQSSAHDDSTDKVSNFPATEDEMSGVLPTTHDQNNFVNERQTQSEASSSGTKNYADIVRDGVKKTQIHKPGSHQRLPSQSAAKIAAITPRWGSVIVEKCKKVVSHTIFEYTVTVVVVLNAVYIGVATNYMAEGQHVDPPKAFDVVEIVFLTVFVTEIGFKFLAYGLQLFARFAIDGRPNAQRTWNIFDCLVIGLQLIEMLFRQLKLEAELLGRVSILRVLRLLRIGRVVRLVKVFRFVADLRTIVYSIGKSFSLFVWSMAALVMMTYLFAVYFTEVVWGHSTDEGIDPATREQLHYFFGSIGKSMLSLLQAVSGGMDWGELSTPLEDMSPLFGLIPFLFYVFFFLLAMMNVITGLFLETATERAKEGREVYMMLNAREIFQRADHNMNGTITMADFQIAMEHQDVHGFFGEIDLDVSQAHTLFELLDTSGDGAISADEFLSGCLRLRGSAKSLDLLVLSREVDSLCNANRAAIMHVQKMLDSHRVSIMNSTSALQRIQEMLGKQTTHRPRLATNA